MAEGHKVVSVDKYHLKVFDPKTMHTKYEQCTDQKLQGKIKLEDKQTDGQT